MEGDMGVRERERERERECSTHFVQNKDDGFL